MFSRELKKGSPELLILALLENTDRHGYEIGKLIEERSGGRLHFRIGSLYPVLCRLEEKGLIKGRWLESGSGPRRRHYHLTAKGRAFLKKERDTWDAYVSAVNQIIGAHNA
jgi:PadR family transcriptional regulator, regulatory protein PadR